MAIAAAFTILALPAIWLFTRGEANSGSAAPTIAGVGVASPSGAAPAEGDQDDGNAMGTGSPIFIDGPSTPPLPAINQIVVPAEVPGEFLEGRATYKSTGGGSCSSPNAPYGVELTVTNRDNGRSITCVNQARAGLPAGLELELDTAQFAQLAQLVDAPIPVRITWNGSE